MQFHVLTIFPEMFASPLAASLLKKAQEKGILSCSVHNLRDYATGKHRAVNDTPYGGGQGMVMKPEPVVAVRPRVERVFNRCLIRGAFFFFSAGENP